MQIKSLAQRHKYSSIVIVFYIVVFTAKSLELRNHQDILNVLSGSNNPNDGRSWANMFDPWYRDPINHSAGFCFPGTVQVIVKGKGIIRIQDLQINDEILTRKASISQLPEEEQFYTRVTGWLHRAHNRSTRYLKITADQTDDLLVSQHHNLGIQNGSFVFAKDLVNERLSGMHSKQISQISMVQLKGMYSPMTQSNTFIVLTSNRMSKVLAHCYSHIKFPQKYEKIVSFIINVWESVLSPPNYEQIGFQIHPAAVFLMKTFTFLLQGFQN